MNLTVCYYLVLKVVALISVTLYNLVIHFCNIKAIMNNDLKGLCLFLGLTGLAYVALLIIIALLSSVKVFKGIVIIASFSTFLVSLGLTREVKYRLLTYIKSLSIKSFQ